jgi:hypothetical protein
MIVQAVDHPRLVTRAQRDLGRVDLPQVVGALALEALESLAPARPLWGDEVVATQHLVHGRDGRCSDAGAAKLGPDPACAEARVSAAQLADLRLEQGSDPQRRDPRPVRARLEALCSLL